MEDSIFLKISVLGGYVKETNFDVSSHWAARSQVKLEVVGVLLVLSVVDVVSRSQYNVLGYEEACPFGDPPWVGFVLEVQGSDMFVGVFLHLLLGNGEEPVFSKHDFIVVTILEFLISSNCSCRFILGSPLHLYLFC